ncbi:MAG: hypothetical protein J6Y28_06475 [Acholeplasmatales bacterium]|nr:hypothetical protein [Acholeplasmatales bacterium]
MDKEVYYKFLEEEFDLLKRREYNSIINDINGEIEKRKEDIDLSFKEHRMLFSNYKEVVLFCDVNQREITEDALNLDYVTLFGLLGDAYMSRDMLEEALNAFTKAITLSPANILLIQRKINILVKLNKFDEAKEIIFKTFKYCYEKNMLLSQYFPLIDIYKHYKDYKSAVNLLYLVGTAYLDYTEFVANEITKLEKESNMQFDAPKEFSTILDYLKEKNIATPVDLSMYYYSIYNELLKRNELGGALDFLLSSHNLFYDKKNVKLIKKLQKQIKKQK